MYFFTLVTYHRKPFLTLASARSCLRSALLEVQRGYPFDVVALCLLPDHLHVLITLPEDDDDYSKRWRAIKGHFSRLYSATGAENGNRNESQIKRGEAAFWQRRFWEHYIHDENDHYRHLDYIHFNPVKHHYVNKPADWPYSTFFKYVNNGYYDKEWGSIEPEEIRQLYVYGE